MSPRNAAVAMQYNMKTGTKQRSISTTKQTQPFQAHNIHSGLFLKSKRADSIIQCLAAQDPPKKIPTTLALGVLKSTLHLFLTDAAGNSLLITH